MSFRSWCRLHPSGNVLGSSQPCVGGLAPLTPTAPCVLHQFDEDVPRRTLPPRPGYRPRSGSSLRAHPCTVDPPSPCGRDGGPADMDMTWTSPFNFVLGHVIGWQESCRSHQPRSCGRSMSADRSMLRGRAGNSAAMTLPFDSPTRCNPGWTAVRSTKEGEVLCM